MRKDFWIVPVLAAAGCAGQHQASPRPAAVRPAPTAMERQIRNALDAGDGDYQIQALRRRMAAEPENEAVRIDLAAAYRERGYPDIAIEHLRLASGRFPESAAVQLALARTLRGAGMRAEAAETLESFLRTHPKHSAEMLSWLGIVRDEMGQWSSGEAAHRAALEISPSTDSLRNNLGYNLLMQGKHEAAAAEFRKALELNPRSQVARNNLGLSQAQADSPAQAIQSLQAGTDPATAHNNLAAYLIEQGRYNEARRELDEALRYNSAHPAALKNLELVARKDGEPAAMPAPQPPQGTWWERRKSGFRRLFVGPLNEEQPQTKPQSAKLTGRTQARPPAAVRATN